MVQGLAVQLVHRLGVFLQAMEPIRPRGLGKVVQTQSQRAAGCIGEGANCFQRLAHHLAGHPLGLEADRFQLGQKGGDQGLRLGASDFIHDDVPLAYAAESGRGIRGWR